MQKLLLLSTSLHCTNAITHHSCTRPLFAHFHAQLVFARFLHHFTAPTPSLIAAAHAPCSHTFTHSSCLLSLSTSLYHACTITHHSSIHYTPNTHTFTPKHTHTHNMSAHFVRHYKLLHHAHITNCTPPACKRTGCVRSLPSSLHNAQPTTAF